MAKMDDPKKKTEINLLDLRPKRTVKWKPGKKVTIIVPKARNIIGKHFCDALGIKPTYNIHLDEYGSAVWELCDGERTIKVIAQELKTKFGKKVEPLYGRLAEFIRVLKNEGLIKFV
jgi:hypothetical protein